MGLFKRKSQMKGLAVGGMGVVPERGWDEGPFRIGNEGPANSILFAPF